MHPQPEDIMVSLTNHEVRATSPVPGAAIIWLVALALFVAIWLLGRNGPVAGPSLAEMPAMTWIGGFMNWLVNEANFGLFTFQQATRFIAAIIEVPYDLSLSLLATGFLQGQGSGAVQIVPPLIVDRADRWPVAAWPLGRRLAAGAAGCGMPAVHRRLRPMELRDGDAGLDHHRRAAGRRRWTAARRPRLSRPRCSSAPSRRSSI